MNILYLLIFGDATLLVTLMIIWAFGAVVVWDGIEHGGFDRKRDEVTAVIVVFVLGPALVVTAVMTMLQAFARM